MTWKYAVATFVLVAAMVTGCSPRTPPALLESDRWQDFVTRFVTPEGRVIDRDNGGISHSEGQGYGMLLAEAARDRDHFDALWRWSRDHLQRPDHLFSWRFGSCAGGGDCVTDQNNASDGDILIAWALLRAANDWHDPAYRRAAEPIVETLKDRLLVRLGDRLLLLPAELGFQDDHGGVVINLSYLVFPAFKSFAEAFPDPIWGDLAASGLTLLKEARFGTFGLPPDWLRVDAASLKPAPGFPPRYGFDAVRIPLYLSWAGGVSNDLMQPFRGFWRAEPVPAWIDLVTGERAPYSWQTGMQAVAELSDAKGVQALPAPTQADGYYSTVMTLLARVAARELVK